MTFFNATLIFGGLAAAIPIALHLLSRRPPKRVVFPSVQFMRAKAALTQSRVNIKKWWLLAARIAVLILLAAAFAQPVINSSLSTTWISIAGITFFGFCLLALASLANSQNSYRSLRIGMTAAGLLVILIASLWGIWTFTRPVAVEPGMAAPRAVAIIVDNGSSSAWVENEGQRLERTKAIGKTFIDELPASSQICVIDRSTKNTALTIDKNNARNKIRQLEVVESPRSIDELLKLASNALDNSRLETQQIFILSDLTEYSWSDIRQLGFATLKDSNRKIQLTVFDLGEFQGQNWGISRLQIADQTPPANTPTPITFTVYSESTSDARDASITADLEIFQTDQTLPLVQNGEVVYPKASSVDRRSLRVKKRAEQEFFLNLPALPVGTHHGRIRLVGEDALALDDTRYFSVKVLPPSRVLIASQASEEAKIISNAIGSTSAISSSSEYKTDVVSFEDLPIVRLSNYDVAILIDPPDNETITKLTQEYIKAGGQVLISFGNQGSLQSKNNFWFQASAKRWRSPEPGTFLQPVESQHPAIQGLTDNVPWSSHRIQQYWQVSPNEVDQVIAKYAGTNHPAILERKVVNEANDSRVAGKILMITTPFPAITQDNQQWNRLFGTNAWPAWLLCRQSIEYLADRNAVGCNATVGSSLAYQIKTDSMDLVDVNGFLFEPNNPIPSPILGLETSDYLRVGEVGQAGTYWIRGKGLESGFSANLPEPATRTKRVDLSSLTEQFGRDAFQVITNLEDIALRTAQSSTTVSLHSPAILMVAIFFILEQILSNRFYQRNMKARIEERKIVENTKFSK